MAILYNIHVKGRPVSRHIKKPGGFPPSPPKVTKFDTDGVITDESHMQWCIYRRKYRQWKEYLLPFEEVFGVKFNIEEDNEPDRVYLRAKYVTKEIPPLDIKPVQHPLDDIIG
tara:strand:- start:443 stop:781 length:339 start_codon:yes stop_codon:yes gene_type:complete